MSDNRKSFTPMDMLTSGGNGDIGCATPFGYVTAKYQGGEIVCVTVDEGRFVPWSGQGAEPVAVTRGVLDKYHRFGRIEYLGDASVPPDGSDLYLRPQPAQEGSVSSRDDLIQCLLATRGQSEGVAADAILWLFPATTPQQEVDGWVKCSERLPTEADADVDENVWVYDKAMSNEKYRQTRAIWWTVKEVSDYTHWMPTGLKRPKPPKEGE